MVATAISCWTEKLFNKDSNTQTLQKRWGLFYAITSFYCCVFAKNAIHLSIAQLDPLHGYQRSLFLPSKAFPSNHDKTFQSTIIRTQLVWWWNPRRTPLTYHVIMRIQSLGAGNEVGRSDESDDANDLTGFTFYSG